MSEMHALPLAQPPWAETQPLLAQDAPPAPGAAVQKYGSMLRTMMAAAMVMVLLLGSGLVVWLTHSFQHQIQERTSAAQVQELQDLVRLLSMRLEQQQRPLLLLADVVAEQLKQAPGAPPAALRGDASLALLYDGIQFADAKGQVLVNRQLGKSQAAESLDQGLRDALRRGLNDGKPSVQAFTLAGEPVPRLSLYYVVPVRATDGRVLGVLGAGVSSSAQSLLPPAVESSSRSSFLQIFDHRGQLLVSNGSTPQTASVQDARQPTPVGLQVQAAEHKPGASSEWHGDWLVTQASVPWPQWSLFRFTESASVLPFFSVPKQWLLAAIVLGSALALAMALAIIAQPMTSLFRWAQAKPEQEDVRPSQFLEQENVPSSIPPAAQLAHWWASMPEQGRGETAALAQAFEYLQTHVQALQGANRQLQDRLQVLLDYSPVGLVVTERGYIQHIGLPAARILGRNPAELLGKSVKSLSANAQSYGQLIERVVRNLDLYGQFDDEICLRRKDGATVWVRIHGQSMQRLWRGFDDHSQARADAPLVWLVEDVSTQRLVRERLSWKALNDPLTRLPNQEAFALHLHGWLTECADAAAQQTLQLQQATEDAVGEVGNNSEPANLVPSVLQGVLLYLDLDYFSHVNQLGGRAAGDEVLVHMARLIEAEVRPQGWLARAGGDEFAVLLPGATHEQGLRMAQSLCMAVQDWEGVHEGQRYLMGASIGLLVLDAGQYTVTSALRAADMACYAAKRKGRNRVETMAPEGAGAGV